MEVKKYTSVLQTVMSYLSRFLFCSIIPIFYKGMKNDVDESDLLPVHSQYGSKHTGDLLEKNWLEDEAAAKAAGRQPSLIKTLIKTYWLSCLPGGLMQFFHILLRMLSPVLFARLLSFWKFTEDPATRMSKGTAALYGAGMILLSWVAAFFNHQGNLFCQQFGMKLRVATTTLMFRKIMRLDNRAFGDTTAGKVVTILANDMQRFELACNFMHYVWIIPVQIIIMCYLGYRQAGLAALIGQLLLAIITPAVQGVLGISIGKIRRQTADKTDERVKIMTEVINGIQVIKMYAWEIPFQKAVQEKRADELKNVRRINVFRTIFVGLLTFTEKIAVFIIIFGYILLGNTLSANVIYPVQQFMNATQINLTAILPLLLTYNVELVVTLRRIQEFLVSADRPDLAEKLNSTTRQQGLFKKHREEDPQADQNPIRPLSYNRTQDIFFIKPENHDRVRRSISQHVEDIALELHDVSASWTGDPSNCILNNISMQLYRGKLCAVIGTVGSGKSSLLQVILKELPAHAGHLSVCGSLSYASQEAWLLPITARENILFGQPFDPEKYKRVCRACCLEKDFKQFPFGDQTLVGERGVSLSGGQRARINLARSVYREADIYLMDDPLSAVDANVGRLLFEGCINGYLHGRTRVLVTHQIHFLKAADYIVVLNQGRVKNIGTFDELVNSEKDLSVLASLQDTECLSTIMNNQNKEKRLRKSVIEDNIEDFEPQKQQVETRQSGNIKWSVLKSYFRMGCAPWYLVYVFSIVLLGPVASAATDYFLSFWLNNMAKYQSLEGRPPEPGFDVKVGSFTTGQYLIIYGCLVLATVIIVHMRIMPFVGFTVRASANLHNEMLSSLIKGVVRFFDMTSSGTILNRFTKDVGTVDELVPKTLLEVLQFFGVMLTIPVLNAIILYWTLVPSIALMLMLIFLIKMYIKTSQNIMRLEGITKSPIFGMVSSSIKGIATIRSTGAQNQLIDQFDKHQDVHTTACNSFLYGVYAFGFYLDTLCVINFAIIVFILIYFDVGSIISVGTLGLALTQTHILITKLQISARKLVDCFARLISVERMFEYTKIDTEENLFEGEIKPPPSWPMEGRIMFENVSLRYALDEQPVLKNIDITIGEGWKVGIVGRTGAGKSSLITALFRFAYLEGKITIDGIDTALIAKQELRSNITIIPQEPVLFSATIRYNLDPFNIYSDADIWNVLEQVDMKGVVASLDFKVTEGGSNFSVGQRQLLCLARAMLRSNKILIMDEATANVDPQTDHFIQQKIKEHFASCTVLTIAHRLNTIMESDRVLVMSFGQVVEFDHPYALLSDPASHFSSMVRETGEKTAAQLFQVAKDAYHRNNIIQTTNR